MPTFAEELANLKFQGYHKGYRDGYKVAEDRNSFEAENIDFSSIEKRVFTQVKDKTYIGTELVKPDVRKRLREESKYIGRSSFWEILNATIINESANMALNQSKEWEHVLTGKMLKHWGYVFRMMLKDLEKE
jgi:hypothetical protein